jgi:hypothetical protein
LRPVAREGIKDVAGHPLMFRGEVLGVLAVFSRKPVFTVNRFAAGLPRRCSGRLAIFFMLDRGGIIPEEMICW